MNFQKTAIGALFGLGLTVTSAAFADNSVDLAVTGTLYPDSCSIDLSAAEVDLGRVATSTLSPTLNTELTPDSVVLNVLCSAPTPFALRTVDNAAGSAIDTDATSHGLGQTGDTQNIGYYTLRFDGATLNDDSTAVTGLTSTDRATWTAAPVTAPGSAADGPALSHGANYLAFADTGVIPRNITRLNGTLQVNAFIAPLNDLTVIDDVAIAGSATIEIVYL